MSMKFFLNLPKSTKQYQRHVLKSFSAFKVIWESLSLSSLVLIHLFKFTNLWIDTDEQSSI